MIEFRKMSLFLKNNKILSMAYMPSNLKTLMDFLHTYNTYSEMPYILTQFNCFSKKLS